MPQTLHDITLTWPAARAFTDANVLPGIHYYVTGRAYRELLKHQAMRGEQWIESHAENLPDGMRLWRGADDLNGKHVAYFHDGYLGDELIHSAFYRQLRLDYPACDLHAYVPGARRAVARSNQFIGMTPRTCFERWAREELEAFDYWILPTLAEETRAVPENIYHFRERELGIRLDTCAPYVYITEEERAEVRANVSQASATGPVPDHFWNRLVTIQLNATEPERTPVNWYERLRALRSALKGYAFAVVGDQSAATEIVAKWASKAHGPITDAAFFLLAPGVVGLNPRGLLVLAESSRLIIAPDSFMTHAAAAFGVPGLALWQMELQETREGLPIPTPEMRIVTYPRARALDMRIEHEELARIAGEVVGV